MRLDNRRKQPGRKGLRIKARNTPSRGMVRCNAALSEVHDYMDFFNTLLKADPQPTPEPRPLDTWFNDCIEYCLLQKVKIDELKASDPSSPPPDTSQLHQQLARRSKALHQRLNNRPLNRQSSPEAPETE